MKKGYKVVASGAWLLVMQPGAPAWGAEQTTTYLYCDAAEREAVVGVFNTRKVAITLDYQNGQCRFSIDGSPVGSPPLDSVLKALDQIDSGAIVGDLDAGSVESLSFAILAAAPVAEPPDDVVKLLQGHAADLSKCFGAAKNKDLQPYDLQTDEILCRVKVPTGESIGLSTAKDAKREGVRVKGASLLLQVGIASGGSEHFLFVPVSLP